MIYLKFTSFECIDHQWHNPSLQESNILMYGLSDTEDLQVRGYIKFKVGS